MPRKQAKPSRLTAVRIPEELADQIERYRQRLAAHAPWTTVTVTDAVLDLIRKGLVVARKEIGEPPSEG